MRFKDIPSWANMSGAQFTWELRGLQEWKARLHFLKLKKYNKNINTDILFFH